MVRGRGRTCTLRGGVAALLAIVFATLSLSAAPALGAGTTPAPAISTPSPFSPGIPQSTATAPPATSTVQTLSTTSTGSDSGFSGGGIAAIAIGALLILGGIA